MLFVFQPWFHTPAQNYPQVISENFLCHIVPRSKNRQIIAGAGNWKSNGKSRKADKTFFHLATTARQTKQSSIAVLFRLKDCTRRCRCRQTTRALWEQAAAYSISDRAGDFARKAIVGRCDGRTQKLFPRASKFRAGKCCSQPTQLETIKQRI